MDTNGQSYMIIQGYFKSNQGMIHDCPRALESIPRIN